MVKCNHCNSIKFEFYRYYETEYSSDYKTKTITCYECLYGKDYLNSFGSKLIDFIQFLFYPLYFIYKIYESIQYQYDKRMFAHDMAKAVGEVFEEQLDAGLKIINDAIREDNEKHRGRK